MRFMITRRADPDTEAGVLPTEQQLADMLAYNEELAKAGMLLAGEGLQPTAKGARIRFVDGKPVVTDGPFTETKELIAGFTMIRANSREEALAWAKRWPLSDGGELELRQLYEADDLGEAFTAELRAKEDRLRQQIEAQA